MKEQPPKVVLEVEPGICGFRCRVEARRGGRRTVELAVCDSDCAMIQALSASLQPLTVQDLFVPVTRNPVFQAAEDAGCHLSCPIPTALIKAAEVALELALPREVRISEPIKNGTTGDQNG